MLEFLQALVSNELASGIVGNSSEIPLDSLYSEHSRLVVLRVLSSLGRIMFYPESNDTKSIPIISKRIREMYAVMLIAVANNHDVSPPGREGFYTPEMM